jgi:hypothetical protein
MTAWRPLIIGVASLGWLQSATAPQPARADILRRLDAYLMSYESQLSTVVADEEYAQQWTHRNGERDVTEKRLLESDFVFLKTAGDTPWFGFRDTYVVDGRPVRDRDARLERLLSDGGAGALARALGIGEANARYNLGDVDRTLNVPTQVLDLIHPRHAGRFRFTAATAAIEGRTLWRIDFRETLRPTLIRTRAGANEPASGSVWMDPSDGAVTRTVLTATGGGPAIGRITTRITVEFSREPELGFLVPTRMMETYSLRAAQVTGTATYSNFRQLRTAVRLVPDASRVK